MTNPLRAHSSLLSDTSRVRVVRIIDRLNIGGPAKHVVWLTAGLNTDEFETVLITGAVPPGEGDMSYFAREAGIEPLGIREMSRELSPRDLMVVAKLLRQLWRLKPQIVHTHKAKAGAVGRLAAMIYKWAAPSALWLRPRECRVVHTYHGHIFHSYYGPAKTRLFLVIERLLARLCTDRIIVISDEQRREIAERFRVGRTEQFRVIPLGIDLDEAGERLGTHASSVPVSGDGALICHGPLAPTRHAGSVRTQGEVHIGIVGRLCEVKNHAMLLEAAARLIRGEGGSQMPIRLIIIGDGHLRGELERLACDLGIADRVIFTGFRADALSLYADLDLVALTSLNEGTPLTLIEAMHCSRAVVATEVGGVVDLMGRHQARLDGFSLWDHGVTAPSRDGEAFARALRFLIERPVLRREMGARGREFVRARLSKERLVREIEALYGELIGRGVEAAPSCEPAVMAQTH